MPRRAAPRRRPGGQTMKVGTVELNPGEDGTQRQAVLKTVRTAAQLMQARSPKRRYDLSEK